MGTLSKTLFAALGFALAACSGFQLDKATDVTPQGSAFDTALYRGYVELSKSEFAEGDYADSDFFALRAIQSGSGGRVAPQQLDGRRLPEAMVPQLASARRELTAVLEKTASQKAPKAAARAQLMFDCWLQEQEENFQTAHIAACRNKFFAALEEAQLAVKPPAPKAEPEQQQPVPVPEPRPEPVRVVILFDFDSVEVRVSELAKIQQVITAIRGRRRPRVSLSGHTDRAGSETYNNQLSEQRVAAVANALNRVANGDTKFSMLFFGEGLPAVDTGDGVREPRNRRVEIVVN